MNSTRITVVGTVLTKPERKVLERSGTVVTNFKVIAHHRRYDEKSKTWVDTSEFRVKVNCWRRLAEHVFASIDSGDPVVVTGRISTRDWKTEAGEPRVTFEVDGESVGHDLSRGTSVFTRARHDPSSVVEDEESENRVHGEPTHPFAHADGGNGYEDSYRESTIDAETMLRAAGLDETPGDEEDSDEEELVGAAAGVGGPAGRSRRRGRATEPV
jgi:single-strand DNA-binding protein